MKHNCSDSTISVKVEPLADKMEVNRSTPKETLNVDVKEAMEEFNLAAAEPCKEFGLCSGLAIEEFGPPLIVPSKSNRVGSQLRV
jgi:hypothetical protein